MVPVSHLDQGVLLENHMGLYSRPSRLMTTLHGTSKSPWPDPLATPYPANNSIPSHPFPSQVITAWVFKCCVTCNYQNCKMIISCAGSVVFTVTESGQTRRKPIVKETFVRYQCTTKLNLIRLVFDATTNQWLPKLIKNYVAI